MKNYREGNSSLGSDEARHRHRSVVLLASGEQPQDYYEQKLTPYVNAATKKATAKTGEEQNQVSFLVSYLISYLYPFIGFIILQILVLFTMLCYKRESNSEGNSSPATDSVNTTPPRVGETPDSDDKGQQSPTSSSIPSTRDEDNDASYTAPPINKLPPLPSKRF